MAEANVGSTIEGIAEAHGFAPVRAKDVSEIGGAAYEMVHRASGARLLLLENDDPEKAFAITFKTPAEDDTGVFHILEHSVLCGSDGFPVKEPFVNLLKSSMQTFLNAMTFPDKTMYPVASTNGRDLMNLMDVYMDAVFHPLIYRRRGIFEQEGWHLEVDESAESAGAAGGLAYNGVVFNEMKGALSDPDSVLYDALSAALFPDTTYRFESGGVPEHIVDLTYERFLDAHARHYRPDNAYIVLYGDVDADALLGFLDERYLAPLAGKAEGGAALPQIGVQAPVVETDAVVRMATAPENACAAVGSVVGMAADRERVMAADILMDAIMGSNEAPLKRAILDAGIADDAFGMLADSIAQPFAMIEAKGLRDGAADRFLPLVQEVAARLAGGGLDHALIEASLSHAEFTMREMNTGYATGVAYAVAAMAGWLYDEGGALSYIEYEDLFASLRSKVDEGYFERLLRELFCESDHFACVRLVPQPGTEDTWETAALAALARDLTPDRREDIARNEAALRAAQNAPDDPADVAKLPMLSVDDIGDGALKAPFRADEKASPALVVHDIDTHGIAYFYRYFDLGAIAFDELPYAALLAMVLGKMDTDAHTAAELDVLQQVHLGNLSFFTEVFEDVGGQEFCAKLVCGTSCLSAECGQAARLSREVMTQTRFRDPARLRDIFTQKRVAMETAFANAGQVCAMQRAASYCSQAAVVREQLGGVDFYRFLKALLDDFDARAEEVADKLADLAARLFTDDACVLSFAGASDDLECYRRAFEPLETSKRAGAAALAAPEPRDRHEAIVVPTDVTYTALAAPLESVGARYAGDWLVASRMLTYDYLWHEVRVVGGAYGTGFAVTASGASRFYSYRDPHVDETLARFDAAGAWLSALEMDEREFAGYIVSTAASFDAPLKPRQLMRRQDGMYFSGYTPEARRRSRAQVVATTQEDLRALGAQVTALAGRRHACTVGNAAIIEAADADFDVVRIMEEGAPSA